MAVAAITAQSAMNMTSQIVEENKANRELVFWFIDHYSTQKLDAKLGSELEGLTPEEMVLKRMDLIQDILITQFDIQNQSYADSMAEEIYGKLYEDS